MCVLSRLLLCVLSVNIHIQCSIEICCLSRLLLCVLSINIYIQCSIEICCLSRLLLCVLSINIYIQCSLEICCLSRLLLCVLSINIYIQCSIEICCLSRLLLRVLSESVSYHLLYLFNSSIDYSNYECGYRMPSLIYLVFPLCFVLSLGFNIHIVSWFFLNNDCMYFGLLLVFGVPHVFCLSK